MTGDERASRAGTQSNEDPTGESSPEDQEPLGEASAQALAAVIAEVRGIRDHLERLVRIEVDRARLRLRARLFGLMWIGFLAMVLATATVTAVVIGVAGLGSALGDVLGGPAWIGRVAIGALALLGVSGGLIVIETVLRRRGLARMKKEYEAAATPNRLREKARQGE